MSQTQEDFETEEALPTAQETPVRRVLGGLAALLSSIGTVWIGLLMLLIVADVLGRNFLNAPITGVSEIAAHSVVAIVFLQVALAILQGRITRADFLLRRIERASPPVARMLEALFSLGGAVVFSLLAWASWPKAVDSWNSHEFFGVQGVFTIPTFPFRAIIVLGAGLAAASAFYVAAERLTAMRRGRV